MSCLSFFVVVIGEDEDEFENFMLPLTVSFENLAQLFNNSFKQEEAKVGCFSCSGGGGAGSWMPVKSNIRHNPAKLKHVLLVFC